MIELSPEVATHLGADAAAFDRVFELAGEQFRCREGRKTLRVEIGGQHYFLKRHNGYGWKWILRTLLTGGFPVISARTERAAIQRLQEVGIPTVEVVGFGERGRNPATRQSFLLMRELTGCRDLDKLCKDWPTQPPASKTRRAIIHAVATTANKMHAAGMNHRDFHLDHLWLESAVTESSPPRLHVIDLHRAMRHRRVPLYWLTKDLAGLLFSAWDHGITKSDCLRFVEAYRGRPIREVLRQERWLWSVVVWRARHLFRKFHGRSPAFALSVPNSLSRVFN